MQVALHMRQADVDEVWASCGKRPLEALEYSVGISEECWTGMAGEVPFCIFGVVRKSLLSSEGVPWLLGTEGVQEHFRIFLRCSRAVLKHWRERFARLDNYVDTRNTISLAWLRWLGFELETAEPYGAFRLPFHHFSIKGN